jgi:hypothetical protein
MHLGYGGSSAPKSDRYAMANYEKPLGDIQLKISPLIVDKPNHQLIAALNADYAIAPNREGGRDQWSRKGRVGLSGEYTPIFPEWWQARLPLKMSIDLYDYSEQFSNPNRPLSGEVVFDMRLTPTLTPFQDAALSFTVLLDYQRRWLSYDDKVARDEFAKSRQTGEVGARVDIGKVRRKKGIVPRVSAGATFLMGKSEVPNRDVKSTKGETRDLDGNHFMLELNFEKFSLAGTYNRLADGTRTSHHGMLSAAPDLDKAGQFKFTLGSTEAFAMDSFLISDEQHLFLSDFNFTPRYDDSWVPLFLIFSWKSQAGPLWAQCFSLNALAEWERTGDKNDGGGGGDIGYDFWQLMHGCKK